MFAKISRGRVGLAEYLLTGRRADSQYLRHEKDKVIPLYGDLNLNKSVEKYLNKHKKFAHNYLHITLSFSRQDMDKLYAEDVDKRMEILQELAKEYISFHASGYRLDSEVVAYAEAHEPIIKEEHGKERLLHIHIQIMNYNPADDTTLRTHFAISSDKDNLMATYINKKYNLDDPMDGKIDKIDVDSKITYKRKHLIERFKNIENMDALEQQLEKDNIPYRTIKTKTSHYLKIITDKGKNINIKGRGFEHVSNHMCFTVPKNYCDDSVELLARRVDAYKNTRACQIGKRRSKKSLRRLSKHYDDKPNKRLNSLDSIAPLNNKSYQQKIFHQHYKNHISHLLTGYYLTPKSPTMMIFSNKKKDIEIKDRGNSISANNSSESLKEKVTLMLQIAEAKEWNLLKLRIRGSKLFRAEMSAQIKYREEISKITQEEATIKRPTSVEQVYKKEMTEKKELKLDDGIDELSRIKKDLSAKIVLDFAIEKYKLYAEDYEVTDDNKINNLRNRQKPKNVIDFLCSEVNLPVRLAIETVRELYITNKNKGDANKNSHKQNIPKI